MDKNNITIRLERKEDYRTVENLVRESFWNVYRPGAVEHFVLKCLRQDADFVQELDFVMEKDGSGFAEYEKTFPFKEKLKLPGQLF